jgi:hypothetical protein
MIQKQNFPLVNNTIGCDKENMAAQYIKKNSKLKRAKTILVAIFVAKGSETQVLFAISVVANNTCVSMYSYHSKIINKSE